MTTNNEQHRYVPTTKIPPNVAHIAAAKLIIKRVEEGKSNIEITPKIRYLAEYR